MPDLFDRLMAKFDRKRFVYDRVNDGLYLTRYYVFLKERSKFPFNIFLHRFHKSDDEVFHDHPWAYATFVLKGGYYEWVPEFDRHGAKIGETRYWRGPGHFRICRANSYHRIELKEGVVPWTLFMPGPKQREWGFLVQDQWVPHYQYLTDQLKLH